MDERQGGKRRKLSRSETVSVRLDPKLRYLAGLAAHKHRRTVSSFIEWAIEESLKSIQLRPNARLSEYADALWDVFEPERFVKLALLFPEMLSHEQQIMWRAMQGNGNFWLGAYDKKTGEWSWSIRDTSIHWPTVRKYWDALSALGRGDVDESALPKPPAPKPEAIEDDGTIPF